MSDEVDLDFVFIRDEKPYRVKKVSGEYWICWLHPDKKWVTLHKVEQTSRMWLLQNECIDWKHSHLYECGHPFNPKGWPSHDSPAMQTRTTVLLTKLGMSPKVKIPLQNNDSVASMIEESYKCFPDWQVTVVEQENGNMDFASGKEWLFNSGYKGDE